MTTSNVTITPLSPNQWLIRAERASDGHRATGQVVVRQDSAPQPDAPPHAEFAGARAWLALAQTRQSENDVDGAVASAQAGLQELGNRYFVLPLRTTEDTTLRIGLAKDLVKQGRPAEAARVLIDALDTRLRLYAQGHADTIVE